MLQNDTKQYILNTKPLIKLVFKYFPQFFITEMIFCAVYKGLCN